MGYEEREFELIREQVDRILEKETKTADEMLLVGMILGLMQVIKLYQETEK